MKKDRINHIQDFFRKIKSANKESTKREAFKDLLNRLYAGNIEIERIIDSITLGAETNIANIPRKDKLHRGSADTLYNRIIIEYENDLKVSLKHAKEQLAGYLLGQFKTSKDYNYTLIASDFINWKIFAPTIEQLKKLETLHEDELILNEIASASFTLTETNGDDFYFWIDRFLFKEEKQKATLKRIEEAFGYQSNVFIESFRELSTWFNEAKKFGEVQVSFEQWNKFLSIAYGKFEATESNFLIHTYLSVFSKMLAYSVVSNDAYINEDELKGILDGHIFDKYNISNFVDNDFFYWVRNDTNFRNLKKSFRLIAQEISTFDFNKVDEDVLKGVYQELIDLDTRHALGEYYTPDWLCERVVNEFEFKRTDKILDPSCGSGSFLRAAIHRMKEMHPNITLEELSNQIYGIDIHPLSVQIAKTTMLLALGKDIKSLKRPIHIRVILSNTLKIPDGVKTLTLYGSEFKMEIDRESFLLNTTVLHDMDLYDEAVDVCEALAESSQNKKKVSISTLENSLKQQYRKGGINQQITESFYKIYEGLKSVKEKRRDTIWKFILQNLYKPYFLGKTFNYVIGNPPWFTYSSVRNEEYQNTLSELAEKYNVKPMKVANFPHLEIAAIFLAHCSNYFLTDGGKLAFVLPRSFFSADQHDNTRSGAAKGFKITKIWDLKNVYPLFMIPSCVFFAELAKDKRGLPNEGLSGLEISGKLPAHNCNFKTANSKITEKEVKWFYSKQGNATAFSKTIRSKKNRVNPYKSLFKQGATIVPRTFYFVELVKDVPDFDDRILIVKTAGIVKADAKAPWKSFEFSGKMDSRFLFRTALSKSILPFSLFKPSLVVLPIIIENETGIKRINMFSAYEIEKMGYLNSSVWFSKTEEKWEGNKTEKSKNMLASDRIDFQRGLTEQNLNVQYLVLYNALGKDANATIIDRKEIDLEFFVDYKSYVFYTNDKREAYYLTAILNSSSPNEMMKDFQATGLFGARGVEKKILDIYYPKFNEKNKTHSKLAELSELAHKKTGIYLSDNPPKQELSPIFLGKLRLDIKKHLKDELEEIDILVDALLQ